MIKVLLADDHSIMRAGLRRIIEESEDIEVIAEADDGRTAIQLEDTPASVSYGFCPTSFGWRAQTCLGPVVMSPPTQV